MKRSPQEQLESQVATLNRAYKVGDKVELEPEAVERFIQWYQ